MSEKKQSRNSDGRARVWTFIAYPESAPENPWLRIRSLHIPFAVSPLHDKDKRENQFGEPDGSGELKKPHWHVILYFDGKKSYEQVKEISDLVNGAPPERVASPRGMTRYLIHLDDPDKYQYDKDLIQQFSGADVSEYFSFSATELSVATYEIESFCIAYNITEFADLIEHARIHEKAWHYVLTKTSTTYFTKYLQSRRHRASTQIGAVRTVINEDGEII